MTFAKVLSAWQALNQESLDLYHKGNYERAVEVGKRALEVAEKNVGPDHPDVATSLNNFAHFSTATRASTRRRSRSTSAPWRSWRRPSARIIRMWPGA